MTCVVGLVDNGTVWIGADSAGVAGMDIVLRADEKVFRNGEFLFGFTTSFRMGQILRYGFLPPERAESKTDMEYLVVDVMAAIRSAFEEHGFLKKQHGQEEGGTFLLGYRGGLYVIADDFQVGRHHDPFAAVGCGESYALGALHATEGGDLSPHARILVALDASTRFSAGVRPPFVVLSSAT